MDQDKHDEAAADEPLLELIVKTWATWQRAEADLAAHGSTTLCKSGYEQQRASVAISLKNRHLLRQLLNEIGATPSRRTTMNSLPADNELERFLERSRKEKP